MSELYDLYIAAIGSLDEYGSDAPEHKIAKSIKQLEDGIKSATHCLKVKEYDTVDGSVDTLRIHDSD